MNSKDSELGPDHAARADGRECVKTILILGYIQAAGQSTLCFHSWNMCRLLMMMLSFSFLHVECRPLVVYGVKKSKLKERYLN